MPHLPNRLLLFRSLLYHTSDRIHFREGYGNERHALVFTNNLEETAGTEGKRLLIFDRHE